MDFKIPDIAKGTVAPHSVTQKEMEEAKETKTKKQQYFHDFVVALVGAVVGAILTNLSSIINFFTELIF